MNQTVSLYEFDSVERKIFTSCQVNCFQGEASAIYDPCGNMISLVANSIGAEVWSRAIDKNSTQAIGLYNPHAIEMPFVGDGTVIPPYEEPIVSPIAFTIGKGGFNVKDHLASNTDLTIAIGHNGAHVTINGGDDCEESLCGGAPEGSSPEAQLRRCVNRCFALGGWDRFCGLPDTHAMWKFKENVPAGTTAFQDGRTYDDVEMSRQRWGFQSILSHLEIAQGIAGGSISNCRNRSDPRC
ncbi:MAG: hypothetical protein PHX86_08560 [Caldisericia bacterium]|nr:hypothetical protein [Caldisericia bacterium]